MDITREEFDKLSEDIAAIAAFVEMLKQLGAAASTQGGMVGLMMQKAGLHNLAGA